MATYTVTRSDEYLEHHGIKGQKWGERNGPPYPLDYKMHTPEEKKYITSGDIAKMMRTQFGKEYDRQRNELKEAKAQYKEDRKNAESSKKKRA